MVKTAPQPQPQLTDPGLFINRQTSWLAFNDRVLANARDERHPLLERVRFLSISETNLDEFFMIRVAGLHKQVILERPNTDPDGMSPEEQLSRIHEHTTRFFAEQRRILREELLPALAKQGVNLRSHAELSKKDRQALRERFKREVLPILTPLAIDPAHPFPHISNLSLNLLVVIHDKGRRVLARVKAPNTVPRFMQVNLQDGATTLSPHAEVDFVRLEEVVSANLDELFPGKKIAGCHTFQVTRDADLDIQEDEAADLLSAIEYELDQRRFGESVRLVVSEDMPERLRTWLAGHLGTEMNEIYEVSDFVGLSSLEEFTHLTRPDLLYPPLTPRMPRELARDSGAMFQAVQQGDVLLYHPYDSFAPVVDFVRSAASDPDVLAIKQTLYRVGANSPIVAALLAARDEDTQVAVLVELKARFDEQPNIGWARQLEAQGVHVAYGLVGLKTHCKVALIVRREKDGLHRYVHLGTGNYNPGTARIYTDFSYFTDDPEICDDAADLFNYLTGYSRQDEYLKLLVAPVTLRKRVVEMIERERERASRGEQAQIIFKLNNLTDPQVIDALYRASRAGVRIKLLIRSICCLAPGLKGVSDNIRVTAHLGRFLEHARIYIFGSGDTEEVYLGSADLMQRNLDDRVETLFPVPDKRHRARIRRIAELQMEDNVNAWDLRPNGRYERRKPKDGEPAVDSQAVLLREPLEG